MDMDKYEKTENKTTTTRVACDVPAVVEVNVALFEFSKLSLLCILLDGSELFVSRNFVLFSFVDK